MQGAALLLVELQDSLVPLEEGQGRVVLEVEVHHTDDLLLKTDELLTVHLLTKHGG